MMDFLRLAAQRGSIRGYKPDPIDEEKLLAILEAARMAPTTHNNQPFRLVVIHTAGRQEELSQIYSRPWFTQAPIIICIVGVPDEGWVRESDGKNYFEVDVAIVMDHLVLAATNAGLGTCWIVAFNPKAAREILGLPDSVIPMAFTPLGYPNAKPREKIRKPLAELVKYEIWE